MRSCKYRYNNNDDLNYNCWVDDGYSGHGMWIHTVQHNDQTDNILTNKNGFEIGSDFNLIKFQKFNVFEFCTGIFRAHSEHLRCGEAASSLRCSSTWRWSRRLDWTTQRALGVQRWEGDRVRSRSLPHLRLARRMVTSC